MGIQSLLQLPVDRLLGWGGTWALAWFSAGAIFFFFFLLKVCVYVFVWLHMCVCVCEQFLNQKQVTQQSLATYKTLLRGEIHTHTHVQTNAQQAISSTANNNTPMKRVRWLDLGHMKRRILSTTPTGQLGNDKGSLLLPDFLLHRQKV